MGIFYVQGEDLLGEKLSKLATLYLLALKFFRFMTNRWKMFLPV